jgi:hypothetical protein
VHSIAKILGSELWICCKPALRPLSSQAFVPGPGSTDSFEVTINIPRPCRLILDQPARLNHETLIHLASKLRAGVLSLEADVLWIKSQGKSVVIWDKDQKAKASRPWLALATTLSRLELTV